MKKAAYNYLMNVTRGWMTTLLGIALGVLLLTLVYEKKATLQDTIWTWAVVALLLGVDEKKLLAMWRQNGTGGGGAAGTYVLVLCALLLGGCRTARPLVTGTDTIKETTDSTTVKETVRFVPYAVAGDTVEVVVPCPDGKSTTKAGKTETKKGRATLRTQTDSTGKTTVECECEAVRDSVLAKDREITRLRTERLAETKTVTVEVYKTHWYDRWARWLAALALLMLGLRAYRFYQSFRL